MNVNYIIIIFCILMSNVSFGTEPSIWARSYNKLIDSLKSSEVNQLTFHIAYDDDDMAVIADRDADFGSKWRQRDMDYVSSLALKEKLKKNKRLNSSLEHRSRI